MKIQIILIQNTIAKKKFFEKYYKLNDFLACKETDKCLVVVNNYENKIEPQIRELYDFFKKNLDNNGIRFFNKIMDLQ